jgi:hypothetical protein
MSAKLKRYLLIFAAAFFVFSVIGASFFYKQWQKEKERDNVLQNNQYQLLAENLQYRTLWFNQKTLTGRYLTQRDSLSRELNIRPKTITKYIEKVITQQDTIIKEVRVTEVGNQTWKISDSDKCWEWTGLAKLEDKNLAIQRTGFSYHNKVTDVYYWKRRFPVIGRKKYFVDTVSECGDAATVEINIAKGR